MTGELIHRAVPHKWRWFRRSVSLIDGTSLTIPDTKSSQTAFPQQGAQKAENLRGQKPKTCGVRFVESRSHAIFEALNALDLLSPLYADGLALLDKVLETCSINDSSHNAHSLFVASRMV
jgi:hypothetical protein